MSEDEWVERIRAAFESAVERQLVSDVPLGSYLSGGMDSASIVASASGRIPRLMTFTGGFVSTMPVASDVIVVAPPALDACTTTRIVWPTSSVVSV